MSARHLSWSGCFFLCVCILVSGCARQQVRLPETGPPVEKPPPGKTGPAKEAEVAPPCAPAKVEPVVIEKEKLPEAAFMEERIATYSGELEFWQEMETSFAGLLAAAEAPGRDQCRRTVEDLLHRYRMLQEFAASIAGHDAGMAVPPCSPVALLADDIAFAAGNCRVVRKKTAGQLVASLLAPQPGETTEKEGGATGGEEGGQPVITAFMNLQRLFPEEAATEQVRLAYADALARSGDWRRAVSIYNDIANSAVDEGRSASLRRKSADLLLSGGDLAAALRLYEALIRSRDKLAKDTDWAATHADLLRANPASSPVVSLYRLILGEYLRFDGRNIPASVTNSLSQMQAYYADAPITGVALALYGEMRQKAVAWEEEARARILRLLDQGDVEAARRLEAELAGRGMPSLPVPITATPQPVGTAAEPGAMAPQEATGSGGQLSDDLANTWDEAMSLYDQRSYDDAIASFSSLLNTQYADRAREKIVSASTLAAEDMRRRAAELFLKARRLTDPQDKRNLLLESRGVLEAILQKYPQAEVIDKVRRNMQVIDGELQQSGGSSTSATTAGGEAGN